MKSNREMSSSSVDETVRVCPPVSVVVHEIDSAPVEPDSPFAHAPMVPAV